MDHRHTLLTTQGHGGPPRMSDQPNAGATSETAQTWKRIHTKHTLSHPNKANMEWWLWRPNDMQGPWGPKVSWHLSYRWGKTPKNLTQETCPDRGSNAGPLRDKRTCYHLLHSGRPSLFSQPKTPSFPMRPCGGTHEVQLIYSFTKFLLIVG